MQKRQESPESNSHYTVLEHTADIGIKAWGTTREKLFMHAAEGVYGLALKRPPQTGQETLAVRAQGEDMESTLVNFLKELIYLLYTRKLAAVNLRWTVMSARHAEAEGDFEHLGPEAFGREVKSPTYHRLLVEHHGKRWQARVYFDV